MAGIVRVQKQHAFNKVSVWTSLLEADVDASPTLTSGSGAPSASEPKGSVYLRTGGTGAYAYVATDAVGTWSSLPAGNQTIVAATGTAIPVTHSGSFPITQNGAETNTLAIPTFLGQTLTIFVDTDTSGARVITASQRINQAANTVITLTEVGDFIKLEAITIGGALRWQVIANDGAVLS